MKKLFVVALATIMLSACGSNVDTVKSGTMEFNQTISVGEALDNWSSCQQGDWDEFETDNGVTVVEFTCKHEIAGYVSKLKTLLKGQKIKDTSMLDLDNITQTFQFTINKDDSFQIDYVENSFTWKDGKTVNFQQKEVEELKSVYNNDVVYNAEDLNASAAFDTYYALLSLKSTAK